MIPRVERIGDDDLLPFARAVSRHFYEDSSDEDLGIWVGLLREPAVGFRGWVVRDGDAIVGNYGTYELSCSLPGGGRLPVAGVTAVGVAQTHRRRGLLNEMMQVGLDDAAERGQPVATLFASEAPIYGRYGFGGVAPHLTLRTDRRPQFRDPVDPRLVEPATTDQALREWPAILEAAGVQRPGLATRTAEWWRGAVEYDPASWRDDASARRLVHVPGRGYARFRIKDDWVDEVPNGEVRVGELVATDPEAEAALWQHVLSLDLTERMVAGLRPSDDVLPELVVDRQRVRSSSSGPLYARLLDVQQAFEARGYAGAGDRLVLEVVDDTRDQGGTWVLEAGADGASMRRGQGTVDLRLPVDVLAAVWLGGVRTTQFVGARRAQEEVAGAAGRLDRLLAIDRAPWMPFEF